MLITGQHFTPARSVVTPPGTVPQTGRTPEYYFVIPVAGQSNMMAYGEGVPLPDTLDA
ncbi:hypothetical protein HAZ28_004797, partial [Salmonella enterica]|nr:hypothetical protein [Salmonella enterica]